MKSWIAAAVVGTCAMAAHAQWQMQDSATTASLRGIHSLGKGVAWASGTSGTVLRTEDDGYLWQKCTVPPGAEKLDFRAVQGFDANIAIVMSSGKGDLSRLYKTTDGCQTWKLLFTNPDKDGFWDALSMGQNGMGTILGDPAQGRFTLFSTHDGGKHWIRQVGKGLNADGAVEGAFAASNSSLEESIPGIPLFVTGGKRGAAAYVQSSTVVCLDSCSDEEMNFDGRKDQWTRMPIPVGNATEASGAFAVGARKAGYTEILVAVGGDYTRPDAAESTAAFTTKPTKQWQPATSMPHGYRSSVAYDERHKAWITVGTNGTDVSFDDGKTWKPLTPGRNDQAGADRNWNALSLPFVVGPKGRIAVLRPEALENAK